MMLRKLAALSALPLLLALTACEGDSKDELQDMEAETYVYRGEVVNCLEKAMGKTRLFTCDFESFYQDHPELLEDASEGSEEHVYWVDNDGRAMACVKMDSSRRSLACDWKRFYANYPAAADK